MSIQKILLVNPPFYRLMNSHFNGLSLGLGYIAAVLSKNVYEVKIYNADYESSGNYADQREIFESYDNYKNILSNLNHPLWLEVKENMVHCKHESCGAAEKEWLPYEFEGRNGGLKPHPYCIHCGVVKNISSDRAKPMGYYTNMLARMPITKVQMRLIIKELESMDFDDAYCMIKSEQEKVFRRVVQEYCKALGAIR